MKGTWLEPVLWFVWGAIPVTLVLLVTYAIVQQNYREGLNDPQIQMAEDAAAVLQSGGVPAAVMPLIAGQPGARTPTVDIANSLAPWVAVYDSNGQLLESSGYLDQAPPKLPQGVFDTSTWLRHPNGTFYNQGPVAETRFTWQPQAGVRVAVIVTQTPDKKYFVAAGRNMREGEQRIEHEGEIVFAGWLVTLAVTLVASAVLSRLLRGPKNVR